MKCVDLTTITLLTMKTPLCSRENGSVVLKEYARLYNRYHQIYPLVQLCIDRNRDEKSSYYFFMKTDLPLFRSDDRESCLSDEELRISYDSLVECADLIEKTLFEDQDINLEQLIKEKDLSSVLGKRIEIGENKALSKNFKSVRKLEEPWKLSKCRRYASLRAFLGKRRATVEEICYLNQQYPFIIFSKTEQKMRAELSYPVSDLQEEEKNLLERWFNYVVRKEAK